MLSALNHGIAVSHFDEGPPVSRKNDVIAVPYMVIRRLQNQLLRDHA